MQRTTAKEEIKTEEELESLLELELLELELLELELLELELLELELLELELLESELLSSHCKSRTDCTSERLSKVQIGTMYSPLASQSSPPGQKLDVLQPEASLKSVPPATRIPMRSRSLLKTGEPELPP